MITAEFFQNWSSQEITEEKHMCILFVTYMCEKIQDDTIVSYLPCKKMEFPYFNEKKSEVVPPYQFK